MENNIENKAKFFALYYGQHIVCDGLAEGDTCSVEYAFSESIYVEAWLELKPLSSITDEDAIKVSDILSYTSIAYPLDERANQFHVDFAKRHILPERTVRSDVADYLRLRGYAVQWYDLSVEEQVSRGWVKLVGIPEGLYIDKNTLK